MNVGGKSTTTDAGVTIEGADDGVFTALAPTHSSMARAAALRFPCLPNHIGRLTDSRSPIRQAEPSATAAASSAILPTAAASAGNLVFTLRRIQSTTADTPQVFQYSTNLSGWADVPVVAGGIVAIIPNTPQAGTDTVTVPAGTESRIFGRLKVTIASAQP